MKRTVRAMRHSELVKATAMKARMDDHGQLEPVSVDESLTTMFFTKGAERAGGESRPTEAEPIGETGPTAPPTGRTAGPTSTEAVQAALFELS